MAHFSSFEAGGYQLYGSRAVYGLNKRTEIGVNVLYVNTGSAELIEIQPNFKLKFFENESKGVTVAGGAIALVPLTERSSTTTLGLVYAVASQSVKRSYGPRITAGSYTLLGSFEPGTSKRGLLLGYEQPLGRNLTFLADWSSGNNNFGYAAAGFALKLSCRSALYARYNFGNQGRGNNSLGVYYGFNF